MNYTKYDIGDKELAYIAGFIDGEGCITSNSSNGSLRFEATNMCLAPIQFLQDVFGGSIWRIHPKGRRLTYIWHIGGQAAVEVLTTLLPYFKVKREQAMLGIALHPAVGSQKVDIALKLKLLKRE